MTLMRQTTSGTPKPLAPSAGSDVAERLRRCGCIRTSGGGECGDGGVGSSSGSHARAGLARYKVPREVHFVDELPRNPTGKVLKRELAARDA